MLHPVRRLWPIVKRYQKYFYGTVFLSLPLSLLKAGPAPVIQLFFESIERDRDPSKVILYPLAIIAMYVANFVVRFSHFYLLRTLIVRVHCDVKQMLYDKIFRLSDEAFLKIEPSSIISRISQDPTHLDNGLYNFVALFREPITFLLCLGYAFYVNWQLSLFVLGMFPALLLIFRATSRRVKVHSAEIQEANSKLTVNVSESLQGFRVIRMNEAENFVHGRFLKSLNHMKRSWLRFYRTTELSHPSSELVTAICVAAIVYIGGMQVVTNQITIGQLMGFFTAFTLLVNPLRNLNEVNIRIAEMDAALTRIYDFLSWPEVPENQDTNNKDIIPDEFHSLALKNVSFHYGSNTTSGVEKISLELKKGKIIALVGVSGAGKSTIAQLVVRNLQPSSGELYLNGKSLSSISPLATRRLFSFVTQEPFLINDTISANIEFARSFAASGNLTKAKIAAHVLDFEQRLGERHHVGERGLSLSGGERQRVALARAFYRESPIVLFDEATSNLDSQSESHIHDALFLLREKHAILMIAHRLHTVREADEIIVLDQGKILERGSHAELLALNGQYAKLCQAAGN